MGTVRGEILCTREKDVLQKLEVKAQEVEEERGATDDEDTQVTI